MAIPSFVVYEPPHIIVDYLRRKLGGTTWKEGDSSYSFSVRTPAEGIEIAAVVSSNDGSGPYIIPETEHGLRFALLRLYPLERGWRLDVEISHALLPPIRKALDWIRDRYTTPLVPTSQATPGDGPTAAPVTIGGTEPLLSDTVVKPIGRRNPDGTVTIVNFREFATAQAATLRERDLIAMRFEAAQMELEAARLRHQKDPTGGAPDQIDVAAAESTSQKPIVSGVVAKTWDYYKEKLEGGAMPTDDAAAAALQISIETVSRHKRILRAADRLPHSKRSKLAADDG